MVSICGSCFKLMQVAFTCGWISPLSQSLMFWVAHASVSTSFVHGGLWLCLGVHV